MAHPYSEHRQTKVEHSRVAHITKGYATGGAVARGGRTKATNVTINVGQPQAGLGPAAVPPIPMPIARPPMPPINAMPPGGPVPAGGPIRSHGGRIGYAKGGAVPGPAWAEGRRAGTKVTHSPGKNDGKDIGRGRPVTYKTGGAVEHPAKGGMAPKLPGGAGGGESRLAKERMAKRKR